MKKIFLFLTLIMIGAAQHLIAQTTPPAIEWQKCYGGTMNDVPANVKQTSDKGFVFCGNTNSNNNGDVSGMHYNSASTLNSDIWVVKTNSTGTLQWQKCIGGLNNDLSQSIQQTSDSGFIVAGTSYSFDGDLTSLGNNGLAVMFVVRLDKSGNIVWKTSVTNTYNAYASSVLEDDNGNFIVGGTFFTSTVSSSANAELVKISASGSVIWKKTISTTLKGITDLKPANDGGYIVLGSSLARSGYSYDYGVLKTDSAGNKLWENAYGGTGIDVANSIAPTKGGYVVAGYIDGAGGDITSGFYGGYDFWIIRINENGNLVWQKTFGSTGTEQANTIISTADGGYMVGGISSINNGMVTGNHGFNDCWIVKLDSTGTMMWQKSLGGSDYDVCFSIQQVDGGGYIIAGETASNDGNVSDNHTTTGGKYDTWLVKLTGNLSSFSPQSGITGTVITIKGSGLTGSTAVKFGGTPAASFTVLNDSTISATVGAGLSGDVLVATPTYTGKLVGFVYCPTIKNYYYQGCSSYTLNGVNYLNSIILYDTLKSIKGYDSLINVRNIIVHKTIYTEYNDTICYNGNVIRKSGDYTYYLTSKIGCDSVVTEHLSSDINPIIDIQLSKKSICKGQTVTLTATGANSYVWSPGNLTGASITVAPTATTTYSVTGTNQLGCKAQNRLWKTIAAGSYFSIAIKWDGTMWAWGINDQGQLGNSTTTDKYLPVQIGKDNDWDTVSAGNQYAVSLKTDGTIWSWGYNNTGETGHLGLANYLVPTQIGADNNWSMIAAGYDHCLALKNNGTAWGWGWNNSGQIGDGSIFSTKFTPVQIQTDTDWVRITAGDFHSYGLKRDGSVLGWGDNQYGQLGSASTGNKLVPIQIVPGNSWTNVTTGSYYTFYSKNDGTVWASGIGGNYMGDSITIPSTTYHRTPVLEFNNCKNATITTGSYFTIVLKQDGNYWGCGSDTLGVFGNGVNTGTTLKLTQFSTDSGWLKFASSNNHVLAIKKDGTLWGWGGNWYGQVGNGKSAHNLAYNQLTPYNIVQGTAADFNTNYGITVNVKSNLTTTIDTAYYTGCNSILYHGKLYTKSTQVIDTLKYLQGCDSAYHLAILTIQIPVTIHTTQLSGCSSVTYNNTQYYSSTVLSDTIKSYSGCDSIYNQVNIIVNNINPANYNINLKGCNGVVYKNKTYTSSVSFIDTSKSIYGCDTMYTMVNVVINKTIPATISNKLTGCNSVLYNGKTFTSSTVYTDTIRSAMGCDSVYFNHFITIYKMVPTTNTTNLSGCGSVTYKSVVYNTSTILKDTLKNINGCDSIYNIANISVTQYFLRDTFSTRCSSLNWYGTNYTNDTIATHRTPNYTLTTLNEGFNNGTQAPSGWTFSPTISTYPSTYGAAAPSLKFGTSNDQVVTATLSSAAKELSFWLKSQSATGGSFLVEGYNGTSWVTVNNITSYPANGATIKYNATTTPALPAGLLKFRFTYTKSSGNLAFDDVAIQYLTSAGCDSLISLHLTIKKAITNTINLSGCTVTYKGVTYNNSTIIKDTLKSLLGCDSLYNNVNITVTPSISGSVVYPTKGNVIPSVTAIITGSKVDSVIFKGNYNFSCLNNGNYTVALKKNNDINKTNGVTTLDIAFTQSHILGKTLLSSPYKLIAADVNGDGKVSTLDIVYMKRLILGIDTTFTNSVTKQNRLWAFVDSSYVFAAPTNPFPFKDSISFTGLSATQTNQTFIGCKLGDVNWDWNAAVARPQINNTNAVELSYAYPSVRPAGQCH